MMVLRSGDTVAERLVPSDTMTVRLRPLVAAYAPSHSNERVVTPAIDRKLLIAWAAGMSKLQMRNLRVLPRRDGAIQAVYSAEKLTRLRNDVNTKALVCVGGLVHLPFSIPVWFL